LTAAATAISTLRRHSEPEHGAGWPGGVRGAAGVGGRVGRRRRSGGPEQAGRPARAGVEENVDGGLGEIEWRG
jgi:hypothetical protein